MTEPTLEQTLIDALGDLLGALNAAPRRNLTIPELLLLAEDATNAAKGTDVIEEWAEWLVEVGYPYDFWTSPPVPEAVRIPLVHAWLREDMVDEAMFEDYLGTISEEGQWTSVESLQDKGA